MALSKDAKESTRLGDLCQVVPRGRVLQVLVGEKEVRAFHLILDMLRKDCLLDTELYEGCAVLYSS